MNRSGERIRLGVLTFPISGIVSASGALVPGIGINPATDPSGFAKAAGPVGLANIAGVLSLVLLLFGFQALYGFLAGSSVDRWAFFGMMLSVAAVAIFSSFLGILAFVGPVAGSHYLNGETNAVIIISEAISPSSLPVLVLGGFSLFSYVIGSILFGVAVWSSGKLPKWSAVAYAISTPLNATPHYIPVLWFLGGVLLFVGGIGIFRGVWKSSIVSDGRKKSEFQRSNPHSHQAND